MAIELLGHHEDRVKKLAARSGESKAVVSDYVAENVKLNRKHLKAMKPVLIELVDYKRQGGDFLRLPENTNLGDRLCGACSRFAGECWHGHNEYDFEFPDGGELQLPGDFWKGFSVDIGVNKLLSFTTYKLIQRCGISLDNYRSVCCPKEFLPDEVETMYFMGFPNRVKTKKILNYIDGLANLLIGWGGEGTRGIIRVSDGSKGTSLQPEAYILSRDLTGGLLRSL